MNTAPQPELTPRQLQILRLLQAGKVNKEVARELDIGVGTVKQHIVALFKKLKVSNRAMAVSRGMNLFHGQDSLESQQSPSLTADGLLERRPCVVLSLALPGDASQVAVRLMYGAMAALASANGAVFLARSRNAGDVIFGVQRVTEYDVAIALQTARAVYGDLSALEGGIAENLRACLTAGLAVASMKRFGGWTEEAIASAVITTARELLNDTQPGRLAFDAAALDLIEVFGIGGQQAVSPVLTFQELENLHWTGARRTYPLVGRVAELTKLYAALTAASKGHGRLIHIEGEAGMGKSRLCEEISKLCLRQRGAAAFYHCLPEVLGPSLFDTERGVDCSVEEVVSAFGAPSAAMPELVIVDDFHLLPGEQQALLSAAAIGAAEKGKMVVFSGRRGGRLSDDYPVEKINLRRLSAKAIEALVRGTLGKDADTTSLSEIQDIAGTAAGVPLFAIELARHNDGAGLALPLLVVINARLDSLNLDRCLLRAVANYPAAATPEELAANLGEDAESLRLQAERTVAAGVLSWSATGGLSFTHPLLRRAIDSLVME